MEQRGALEQVALTLQTRRPWRIGELPALLGAQVLHAPGGPSILGGAGWGQDGPMIFLNDRIMETEAELTVLGHECVHILEKQPDLQLCTLSPAAMLREASVWQGFARMAVSDEQLEALEQRHLSRRDVAASSGVPLSIVALRQATARAQPELIREALSCLGGFLRLITRLD